MGHTDHEMTAEEMKQHLKGYYLVFGALLVLTVITVAVSYLHLPTPQAVLLAMAVASVKGSLVALFFMHLKGEKAIIIRVLALTFVLFSFCMAITLML